MNRARLIGAAVAVAVLTGGVCYLAQHGPEVNPVPVTPPPGYMEDAEYDRAMLASKEMRFRDTLARIDSSMTALRLIACAVPCGDGVHREPRTRLAFVSQPIPYYGRVKLPFTGPVYPPYPVRQE